MSSLDASALSVIEQVVAALDGLSRSSMAPPRAVLPRRPFNRLRAASSTPTGVTLKRSRNLCATPIGRSRLLATAGLKYVLRIDPFSERTIGVEPVGGAFCAPSK
jgi:hypothetical protein